MMWFARRRSRCVFPAVLAFLVAASGHAAEPTDTVARVGEIAVERQQVDALLRQLGVAPEAEAAQRQRAEAAALEQLIDEQILRAELIRAGMGVTPEAVAAAVDKIREQVTAQGKDFDASLAASDRSLESLREQVALELAIQAYVRPRMTEAAIKRVYEKNRRELDGTQLRVSHIVLRPDGVGAAADPETLRTRAAAIRSEIVQGQISFADAARHYSAGPSRRQDGDMGWINRNGPLLEAFAAEVYATPKGSITEPFLTIYGVHIATVTAVEPGRMGLGAVRERVEKVLASEIVRGLVAEGRKRMPVWIAPGMPHLDPATLGQPTPVRPVVISKPVE